jgi:hypothetical protein
MSDVEDEIRSTRAVKYRKASLIPSFDSTVPLVRQANDAEKLIYLRCVHLGKNTDQEGQKLGQASVKTKFNLLILLRILRGE